MTQSLPTSAELDAENFSKLMGPSPTRPGSPSRLVVLGAINAQNSAHIDIIKQAATSWHRGEQANDNRQVVFVWMDKEKWGGWLKRVYGVKKGPEPVMVIADHGVSVRYDEPYFSDVIYSAFCITILSLLANRSHSTNQPFLRLLMGFMVACCDLNIQKTSLSDSCV